MSLEVALTSSSLAVGLVVLTLTVLNFRRDRERADVDWEVHTKPGGRRGTFAVVNTGRDFAYKVHVEMWDGHDYVTAYRAKLGRNDPVEIVLPHREAEGPDDVELPPKIVPPVRPGETDPIRLAVAESSAVMDARHREQEESTQVSVRVVWRTRRGTWNTHTEQTG